MVYFTPSNDTNTTTPGSQKAVLSPGAAVRQRAVSSSVSGSLETWTSSWPHWLATPPYNPKQLPTCPATTGSLVLNSSGDCEVTAWKLFSPLLYCCFSVSPSLQLPHRRSRFLLLNLFHESDCFSILLFLNDIIFFLFFWVFLAF